MDFPAILLSLVRTGPKESTFVINLLDVDITGTTTTTTTTDSFLSFDQRLLATFSPSYHDAISCSLLRLLPPCFLQSYRTLNSMDDILIANPPPSLHYQQHHHQPVASGELTDLWTSVWSFTNISGSLSLFKNPSLAHHQQSRRYEWKATSHSKHLFRSLFPRCLGLTSTNLSQSLMFVPVPSSSTSGDDAAVLTRNQNGWKSQWIAILLHFLQQDHMRVYDDGYSLTTCMWSCQTPWSDIKMCMSQSGISKLYMTSFDVTEMLGENAFTQRLIFLESLIIKLNLHSLTRERRVREQENASNTILSYSPPSSQICGTCLRIVSNIHARRSLITNRLQAQKVGTTTTATNQSSGVQGKESSLGSGITSADNTKKRRRSNSSPFTDDDASSPTQEHGGSSVRSPTKSTSAASRAKGKTPSASSPPTLTVDHSLQSLPILDQFESRKKRTQMKQLDVFVAGHMTIDHTFERLQQQQQIADQIRLGSALSHEGDTGHEELLELQRLQNIDHHLSHLEPITKKRSLIPSNMMNDDQTIAKDALLDEDDADEEENKDDGMVESEDDTDDSDNDYGHNINLRRRNKIEGHDDEENDEEDEDEDEELEHQSKIARSYRTRSKQSGKSSHESEFSPYENYDDENNDEVDVENESETGDFESNLDDVEEMEEGGEEEDDYDDDDEDGSEINEDTEDGDEEDEDDDGDDEEKDEKFVTRQISKPKSSSRSSTTTATTRRGGVKMQLEIKLASTRI